LLPAVGLDLETARSYNGPMDRKTFVFGDVHGHLERLKALYEAAGVESSHYTISLGDLGHYGISQSKRADADTWAWAYEHVNRVIWGNHDYAVFHPQHLFGGYQEPFPETIDIIKRFITQQRMSLALDAHSFLLTHAGLHKSFMHQRVPDIVKQDPHHFVSWVSECETTRPVPDSLIGVRDAISGYRGGGASAGGILWRDAREKLYPNFRQIFGHTAKDNKVRKYPGDHGMSYCIDIGTTTNGRLAGIWLPSEEVIDIKI
jgi:predicted phosphodiesterase